MGRINPWTITVAPNDRATVPAATTAINIGYCVGFTGGQVATAGADVYGLAMQNAVINEPFSIVVGKEAVGRVGAAVAQGSELATTADGRLVTATAGQFVVGRALEPASTANEYIRLDVTREGKKA
jgi:hypothetical protein